MLQKQKLFFIKQNISITIIALIFGSTGTLAFSPFNFWIAAILSIFGLNLLIINKTNKQSFLIGLSWGIGLFSTGIHWIYICIASYTKIPSLLNIFLVSLFVIYLSLYPGCFAYIINKYFKTININRMIFASPAIWQIIEYLRSIILTGFPWLQFGYSQIDGPLKYLAPIFGVEMITFILIIISNCLIYGIIKKQILFIIIAITLLFTPQLIKNYNWIQPNKEKKIQIVLIQGNIEQNLKWNPKYIQKNIDTYIKLSKPFFNKEKIIIWPESAITENEFLINNDLILLDKILRSNNTILITGIIDSNIKKYKHNKYYNNIIILGDKNQYKYSTSNRYQKHHLVPFGEFIPLQKILLPIIKIFNIPISNFIQGDYKQKQLKIKNLNITAAICYEIILGKQIRDNFKNNTDFILTITNDMWFGKSIGPWQHFQMARMRALELGRPLIQASNNGITAIINSNGSIKTQLPQFIRSVLIDEVISVKGSTPYTYFSYYPLWTMIIIIMIYRILNK